MSIIRNLVACALAISAPAGVAAVIWDEAVDGDISDIFSIPTDLGTLTGGSFEILAGIDAGTANNGPDAHDYALVSIEGDWTVDLLSASIANTDSLLIGIYSPDFNTDFGFDFLGAAQSDLFGVLAAGDYLLRVTPSGNVGQAEYSLGINVTPVPLPSALVLLLSGIVGLKGISRVRAVAS